MDLKKEKQGDAGDVCADPDKPSFARACLLARRMIEGGVRFVNIYHEGWDAHSDVAGQPSDTIRATDQASAVLVMDLPNSAGCSTTPWRSGAASSAARPWSRAMIPLGRISRPRPPSPGVHDVAGGRRHQVRLALDVTLDLASTPPIPYMCTTFRRRSSTCSASTTRTHLPHSGRDFRLTDVHGKVVKGILA